jgi:succinate dehydrogenase / fumarate reductase membrane anchor subunit
MVDLRTPLRRALGSGSAKRGVGHFVGQRVSAVALLVLSGWAVWSVLTLARGDYGTAVVWLRSPIDAALAALLAIAAFYHMQIGLRVIIEDYIESSATRALLLIANLFVCWAGAALTIICLLKVAFGDAGAV